MDRVNFSLDRRASDRRVLGGPPHRMERRRGAADWAAQAETKAGPSATGPLAKVTEQLHAWLTAEPWRTGRELLARLQVESRGPMAMGFCAPFNMAEDYRRKTGRVRNDDGSVPRSGKDRRGAGRPKQTVRYRFKPLWRWYEWCNHGVSRY
jgi:hypothetical protein